MDNNKLINKISIILDKFLPALNNFVPIDNHVNVLHFKEYFPFQYVQTDYLPTKIRNSFNTYNAVSQVEYFYKFSGNCIIEPIYGWIILPGNRYLSSSLPYQVFPKPSGFKLKFGISKKQKIDSVISIRYGVGNYWHFFNDILGQFLLVQQQGLDQDIPVLAPKRLLKFAYVREFFERTQLLKQRRWIFQEEDEIIETQEVYLVKNTPNTKDTFLGIRNLLNINELKEENKNRVFLVRGRNRGRRLTNQNEIEDIVKKYSYKIIDTDQLNLKEQISVFKDASIILGIHGAGLSNLIFRTEHNTQLIEIFPANLIPPHYFWLCHELGFKYDAILGSEQSKSGLFSLSAEELDAKLAFIHR